MLIDLGCLVGDLGDPLRFHHMLRGFKLGSPMSVGTWCLTIYSLPLTLVAVVGLLNWPMLAAVRDYVPSGILSFLEWVRKPAVVSGILPAIGSAVYKGVLISTNSQPGWKQARWLGGYLTSAAPLLGTTLLFSLALLMKQERGVATLRICLIPLLALNFVTLAGVSFAVYSVQLMFHVGTPATPGHPAVPGHTALDFAFYEGSLAFVYTLLSIQYFYGWTVRRALVPPDIADRGLRAGLMLGGIGIAFAIMAFMTVRYGLHVQGLQYAAFAIVAYAIGVRLLFRYLAARRARGVSPGAPQQGRS